MINCLSVDTTLQEVWMVQTKKSMYHGILNIIGVSRKAVSRDFVMHSDSWEGERLSAADIK